MPPDDEFFHVDTGGTIHIRFTFSTSTSNASGGGGFYYQSWTPSHAPPLPPPGPAWDAAHARRLYRRLSKVLHPDVQSSLDPGMRDQLMKILTQVYRQKDMATLRRMAMRFCPELESG